MNNIWTKFLHDSAQSTDRAWIGDGAPHPKREHSEGSRISETAQQANGQQGDDPNAMPSTR
jgi:hypothetical protein